MIDPTLRDQIIQRLLAASDAKVAAAKVENTMSLRHDLDISSMTLIALAADLEDELKINIEDDELLRIETVGDLFKVIENHKPSPRAA
jgi:acyl carrier protein